jgi:hypothetical protein
MEACDMDGVKVVSEGCLYHYESKKRKEAAGLEPLAVTPSHTCTSVVRHLKRRMG